MPMWTDLPRAFAGSGLPVQEYGGWQTRGHGTPAHPLTVTPHHTAGPKTGDTPSLNVCVNGRPGLDGPLCNLYLSRSGVVYIIAAGVAWHAGSTRYTWANNATAIGIEAEATGVDAWPEPQYSNFAKMCRCLCDYYRLPIDKIMGHKEICAPPGRKIDPNFDMVAFRRLAATGGFSTPIQPPTPSDLIDEDQDMLIFFDPPDKDGKTKFHGQRTAEAGGGSNVAKAAWISFSSAWGGCAVRIASLDGKGGVKWIFGNATSFPYVKNNTNVPIQLPDGARVVTIEGTRDSVATVPCCDIYNLR